MCLQVYKSCICTCMNKMLHLGGISATLAEYGAIYSCLFTKFLPCYIDPMSSNHTSNISYHLLNYFGTADILKTFVFQRNTVLRDLYCFHGLKMRVVWFRKSKQITSILSLVSWLYQVLQETSLQPLKRKQYSFAYSFYSAFSKPGQSRSTGELELIVYTKVAGYYFHPIYFLIFGSSQYPLSCSDIFSMFCHNL